MINLTHGYVDFECNWVKLFCFGLVTSILHGFGTYKDIIFHLIFSFMSNLWTFYTAFYATSSVVESVRKAQEENSAAILSRALLMCKNKMVNKLLICALSQLGSHTLDYPTMVFPVGIVFRLQLVAQIEKMNM